MTATQLGLPLTGPQDIADLPSGKQHRALLVALYEARARGLSAEEAMVACKFRAAHIAATRLGEMCDDRERFPVALVERSTYKHRATSSGRLSYSWSLTDAGLVVAHDLATNGEG